MTVWGTGGIGPRAEAFLDGQDHRISALRPHHRTSAERRTDLPVRRPACLTTENHLRGRLPVRVTPALPYCRAVPNDPTTPDPEGNGTEGPEVSTPVSDRAAQSRYGNIDPFIHSTTPVGLALGPDSPGDDERGPGTLGQPAAGIFTPLSLLMSAFSLPPGPRQAHAAASPLDGTLSYPTARKPLPRLRWCA